jgi:hypothetical protein
VLANYAAALRLQKRTAEAKEKEKAAKAIAARSRGENSLDYIVDISAFAPGR